MQFRCSRVWPRACKPFHLPEQVSLPQSAPTVLHSSLATAQVSQSQADAAAKPGECSLPTLQDAQHPGSSLLLLPADNSILPSLCPQAQHVPNSVTFPLPYCQNDILFTSPTPQGLEPIVKPQHAAPPCRCLGLLPAASIVSASSCSDLSKP